MALFKELKLLKEQLVYWENYQPSGNMGKWGRSVRLESLNAKITKLQKKISEKRLENKKDENK
jgi:hypothetical protein